MSCSDHNRVRSKTIAFRITPELNEQINLIVAAGGMICSTWRSSSSTVSA